MENTFIELLQEETITNLITEASEASEGLDDSLNENMGCETAKDGLKIQKERLKLMKNDFKLCREKTSAESRYNCKKAIMKKLDDAKETIRNHKNSMKDKCLGHKVLNNLKKGAKGAKNIAKKVGSGTVSRLNRMGGPA